MGGTVVLAAVLALMMVAEQAPSDARVASVQVKGTRRYTPEEVTRLSGVQIGMAATVEILTAAANRLAATGLFDSVRYTYTSGPRQLTVTFEVVEAPWTIPVILDNFVWMPEAELIRAVREEVPSFDGTAPLNVGAADLLTNALQNVLKARGIPGRVDFSTQADLKGSVPKYVFAVKDPAPRVCALRVPGASAIAEKDLLGQLGGVSGNEYSKSFLVAAASGTLTDMYRRRGYWSAAFDAPSASLQGCDGVSVSLNVKEGIAYAWDRAEWKGNTVLATDALNEALGMKAGQVADATRIDTGLRDVHALYGRQGYVTQTATSEPRLDEATRRAVFTFMVTEGPQFRMGTLQFEGIREEDAAMLAKKWRLKAGEVYDDSYGNKYVFEELAGIRTRGGARPRLNTQVDGANRVVNVKISFE